MQIEELRNLRMKYILHAVLNTSKLFRASRILWPHAAEYIALPFYCPWCRGYGFCTQSKVWLLKVGVCLLKSLVMCAHPLQIRPFFQGHVFSLRSIDVDALSVKERTGFVAAPVDHTWWASRNNHKCKFYIYSKVFLKSPNINIHRNASGGISADTDGRTWRRYGALFASRRRLVCAKGTPPCSLVAPFWLTL
jgi:hypothetical protein